MLILNAINDRQVHVLLAIRRHLEKYPPTVEFDGRTLAALERRRLVMSFHDKTVGLTKIQAIETRIHTLQKAKADLSVAFSDQLPRSKS